MPIAHSFMFFLASAGGSVIDIPRKHENWLDSIDPNNPKLTINSEEGWLPSTTCAAWSRCRPPGSKASTPNTT